MLTPSEQKRALTGGALTLAGILLFIGIAVAALLAAGIEAPGNTPLFDAYIFRILRFTLLQAALSTILSILLAIPVARALARQTRFPGRIWLLRLMAVPMGLPVLIGAMGLLGIWGRQGILNQLGHAVGLAQPISIYGLTGILLAHVFFNLPLACRLMLAGLERIPPEYWLLSSGLGMRSSSTFRFIEWPVLRGLIPGISGLIFILCATSFTLVLMLGGGPAATTIEVAIYQSLRFDFDPGRAVALSLLQILLTGIILIALAILSPAGDPGPASGRSVLRMDAEKLGACVCDGLLLLMAALFVSLPLGSVVVAGLKSDLPRLVIQPSFLQALATSLSIALAAGLIAVMASLAIARARYAISEARSATIRLRSIGAFLGSIPSLVLLAPPIVLATGWFMALRPFGDPTNFAAPLIVVINMLMALPFVIRVIDPAYRTHRQQTNRLARSLGLSGMAKFRYVDWPGLRRALLTALSFAMALSLGDLGAVALFGSGNLMTLPWLVYSRLGSYRSNDADGYALLLGLVCLGLTIAGTAGQVYNEQRRTHDR